ncbi:hypothetical protein FACS18948_5130 [Clostridia bacterium]|nr:hypothetical protein FACS18948_5130 [Clostridia bacterium]
MPYSSGLYEYLFDIEGAVTGSMGAAREVLRHGEVSNYRARTITSGQMLEVEAYPIWRTQTEARRAKGHESRTAQKNLNAKNARKRFVRKINANFTEEDLCITLTYAGEPPNLEQARKDMQNYIRRVRNWRQKRGMPELKYVYVIEYEDEGKKRRIHHHVIMSGMDRDAAETLWGKGWANTKRLQPDEHGLEAVARYIIKNPRGSKRWSASRNLVEPRETVADKKLSRRQVERMAQGLEESACAIFSKLYPNHEFIDCTLKRSEFVAGAYVYARMHMKTDRKKVMR